MPKQYNCQARPQAFVRALILIGSSNHQIAALVLRQPSLVVSEIDYSV